MPWAWSPVATRTASGSVTSLGPSTTSHLLSRKRKQLRSSDAVMVRKFGHLGLKQGKWPILGRLEDWDRREWPMPVLVRCEELTGRPFRALYDDNDPNKLLREEQVQPGEAEQGAKDGLLGAGAVEKVLTGLLG